MGTPTIVAMGGKGLAREPGRAWLGGYVLSLTGKERPRVCYIPTATGDNPAAVAEFYASHAGTGADCRHLPLFNRTRDDPRDLLLSQDVIWVAGGNTANMLAIWRVHGVDKILREAWERGIVLCGGSAGSLCWFENGVTDSFGPDLMPIHDGLKFLSGSHCPHYDGEPQRRPTYRRLVGDGTLPPGVAIDDHAAVRYDGTRLAEVVAARPTAGAYRVNRTGNADARETPLEARPLSPA